MSDRDIEHMGAPHLSPHGGYALDHSTVHYEFDPDANVSDCTVVTYAMTGDHDVERAVRVVVGVLLRDLLDLPTPGERKNRAHALRRVVHERERQVDQGWTTAHDRHHSTPEWHMLVSERLGRISARYAATGDDLEMLQQEVERLAAVALAWLEALEP